MIQDWTKYEAYRVMLMSPIKSKFLSLDENTFYDLFQEAFLEKFPVFESEFDSKISNNELGYLYRLVINKINDLLKKNLTTHTLVEIQSDDDYEDLGSGPNITNGTFAEFLYKIVAQRAGLKSTDTENKKTVKKLYRIVTPLIRMEAWALKEPLSEKILNGLSEKVTSDVESEQFFDWIEPTPIVRLISWVGCS